MNFDKTELKKVLMERDELTSFEAEELIQDCLDDLDERLALGELPEDIMSEYFGLEPDFLFSFLFS